MLWRYLGGIFGDVIIIMPLKWWHNWFFKVRFRHNQLKRHNLAKSRNFRWPTSKFRAAGGAEPPTIVRFWRFVTKVMHFRHILAKVQTKNLNPVNYYYFLKVRDNSSIGGGGGLLSPSRAKLLSLKHFFAISLHPTHSYRLLFNLAGFFSALNIMFGIVL